jgi:thioesterase domain-containing protein
MNQATFANKHIELPKAALLSGPNQLVTLRDQGDQTPLFCIHPSGGDVGVYRKLVTRLALNRPVFGIQSRMLCGAENEYSSLHEIASAYAEIIKAKQPYGDVLIVGFSLGGFIATLITEQLHAAGRSVSFLGLIDSNPSWTVAAETSRRELCLRLEQVFTKFQSIGMIKTKPLETVQRDVAVLVDACLGDSSMSSKEVMSQIDAMGYLPSASSELAILSKFANTFLAHCHLLADFLPPQIDCPLHLWWPSDSISENELGSSLWEDHASFGVTESIVEGSHYSIMRGPTVRLLASEIDAALDAARNAEQPSRAR